MAKKARQGKESYHKRGRINDLAIGRLCTCLPIYGQEHGVGKAYLVPTWYLPMYARMDQENFPSMNAVTQCLMFIM